MTHSADANHKLDAPLQTVYHPSTSPISHTVMRVRQVVVMHLRCTCTYREASGWQWCRNHKATKLAERRRMTGGAA